VLTTYDGAEDGDMATKTTLTLDEFLKLSETKPASEFVCGEVIQKPMPNEDHSIIQFFLSKILGLFLDVANLGTAGSEWRFVFGPSGRERAFVPDLAYISRERRAGARPYRGAPELAIEILSPDQHAGRFADKIQFYLLHGVRLVWVFDPETRTVSIFAPGEDTRTLGAGETLDGGDVLPGFTLEVDDVFAQLTN
jgi:Uma2 family endonuclease